jgi:glyoxylase-like metal-dependent hydrolase (beta-lactamase superfamily II)
MPHDHRPKRLTGLYVLLAAAFIGVVHGQSPRREYIVHAVRFATIPFQVSGLVAGADRSRSIDIAMMVWVADDGAGRVVLVDAGFHRERFMRQWQPRNYATPAAALQAGLGIAPESVTDIIVTHVHWDHVDGVDLFPRARVWIQRDEFAHHVGADGAVLNRAIAAEDAAMLANAQAAGRLRLVDGDDREILPGIRVHTGGKHTFASQYVSVRTAEGTVVLASDNAYLYENLEQKLAIAQTLDASSNLAAQARMLTIASAPRLVVPGHDPAVFERFPVVKPGVVRIQ